MPVAQCPSTMSSYQRPKYVVYSEHSNPVYSGSQHEGYRYSMLTSSKRDFYEFNPDRGHHSSSSVAYLLPCQPNFQTKGSTVASSFHFRDPPPQHHHSRSESSYLPSQTYGHRKSRYSAPVPQSSGSDGYDSTRGRGLSRPNSFSQHRSLLPRRSSMHLSRNYSRASRENDPATQESPRVRFIIPATLHRYLSDPPFRISVKQPLPLKVTDYHHAYLSLPATHPTISFMLITIPHLPWTIRLGARPIAAFPSSRYHNAPLAYLSAQDVLDGIYSALREYVTLEEYDALALDREFRDKVVAAYRTRKAQETYGRADVREWMRRVDWLAGRTVFEGLDKSRGSEGVWKLKLGRHRSI